MSLPIGTYGAVWCRGPSDGASVGARAFAGGSDGVETALEGAHDAYPQGLILVGAGP
jgi:hypothetical protein